MSTIYDLQTKNNLSRKTFSFGYLLVDCELPPWKAQWSIKLYNILFCGFSLISQECPTRRQRTDFLAEFFEHFEHRWHCETVDQMRRMQEFFTSIKLESLSGCILIWNRRITVPLPTKNQQ